MVNKWWQVIFSDPFTLEREKHLWRVSGALLLIGVILYLHPYYGIRHDSSLYLAQALLRWDPENFGKDFFFAYGSQADFTLLPNVVAFFFKWMLPGDVFAVFTLLSLVLFAMASYVLARQIFGAQAGYWATLALLIWPSGYGGMWVLAYAETFFTGRGLAEPLVLLALAAYLSKSYKSAAGLWIFAALAHPLQALPGLLLVFLDMAWRRKEYLLVLWLPLLLLIASLAGVPHLERLTERFDPQWFEWVQGPNKLTFVSEWSHQDWIFIGTDIFLLVLLSLNASVEVGNLVRSVLSALVVAFAISYLGYDIARYVLIGGVQIWRVDWLVHWFAIASMPTLLLRQYRLDGLRSVRFLSLMVIMMLGTQNRIVPDVAPIVFILVPLYCFWPKIENGISPLLMKILYISLPLAVLMALIKSGLQSYDRYHAAWHLGKLPEIHFLILSHPIMASAFVSILCYLFFNRIHLRKVLLLCLIVGSIYSIANWDRRSDWTHIVEATKGDGREFGVEIERGAEVYWANEVLAPWLVLRHPSYYSGAQTAGILFNRGTAVEAIRRSILLEALSSQLDACRVSASSDADSVICQGQSLTLDALCRVSAPDLKYVVIDFLIKDDFYGKWDLGIEYGGRPVIYYMYRCQDIVNESVK
jgi:hypothetical protein